MNKFGKTLKDNWFVCLLVLIFAGISIFYIYDSNKGKLAGKSSNGESVVYSINGEDTTTSQFYDTLYETGGTGAIYQLLCKEVTEQAVETTEEMKTQAANQAETIRQNTMSSNPNNYQELLTSDLRSLGYNDYNDLESYLTQYLKLQALAKDYAIANFDTLKIRSISYILIQKETTEATDTTATTTETEGEHTPTADEQARMDAVDAEFAAGKDFATVATDLSEDSSSAPTGGVLGILDINTTGIDQTFLDASFSLKEGEISDWVYSPNFGYFKIMNTASTPETLEANAADGTDPYAELTSNYDTTLLNNALWQKAQELGMDFKDNADLRAALVTYMGIEDTQAAPAATPAATAETSASPEATASASTN